MKVRWGSLQGPGKDQWVLWKPWGAIVRALGEGWHTSVLKAMCLSDI